jgi:flagellar biosynthesis/type III secretory pathway protein FliH
MDFYSTAKAVSLTSKEKAAIKAATDKIEAAAAVSAKYGGIQSLTEAQAPAGLELAAMVEAFKKEPTEAQAEAIAQQAILINNLPAVAATFGGISTSLRNEVAIALVPLANELTPRVIKELDKQLKAAVEGLAAIGGLDDTAAELRTKHARQVEIGNYDTAELSQGHRCALAWLLSTFTTD